MERELAQNLEALHPDAFGWALHCCHGDADRAEEVLQTAYQKVAAGRAVPSGGSVFKTWWFGVIRLTSLEEWRRQRYRESLLGRLWTHFQGRTEGGSARNPSQSLEQDEQTAQLRTALAGLPARQSEILHLVFYQDLTLSEAATVMKISVGSARQHYQRGKDRLRSLLQDSDQNHECRL